MFVDLDWPLNASSLLSASAELLVNFDDKIRNVYASDKTSVKIRRRDVLVLPKFHESKIFDTSALTKVKLIYVVFYFLSTIRWWKEDAEKQPLTDNGVAGNLQPVQSLAWPTYRPSNQLHAYFSIASANGAMFLSAFYFVFFCRIRQKLLNRYLQNSVEWVSE